MIILGVDPGTQKTGFAVLQKNEKQLRLVEHGIIRPKTTSDFSKKLEVIYLGIQEILKKHQPKMVAIEDVFVSKNVRSTLKLGCARGVVMLAAAQSGIPVYEYPPATVKQAIAGYGQADKRQMQKMVGYHMQLKQTLPEDANDALAVALCHLQLKKAVSITK